MNERDVNLSLLIPNVAVLLFVAIGLFQDRAPLISGRPTGDSISRVDDHDTIARLWEDPLKVRPPLFEAPPPRTSAEAPSATPERPLRTRMEQAAQAKADAWRRRSHTQPPRPLRALILPVLLNGESYSEDAELRLRTRHAVLSALARAQWLPTTPNRLQFAQVTGSGLSKPYVLPFEEFHVRALVVDGVHLPKHENDWRDWEGETPALIIPEAYDRVFVLWLDEQVLLDTHDPLERTTAERFAERLETVVAALAGEESDFTIAVSAAGADMPSVLQVHWDLKIIGPSNSDRLLSLLDSPPSSSVPGKYQTRFNAEIISSRATAADAVLQVSATHTPEVTAHPLETIRVESSTGSSWRVRRTITTDDRLVQITLEELRRRGIAPDDTHHLVLVGEWDTLYSRGLARAFVAQINTFPQRPRTDRGLWSVTPDYVREYSYLRGIDGRSSSQQSASSASTPADTEADNAKSDSGRRAPQKRAFPEQASGQSQFDYLRRLDAQIRAHQQSLASRPGERAEISAIGVIGSDPYDKLLVLRALRTSFPHVVFFTTDLDASYLDRGEGAWTSNLLIVSPFGLSAHPDLQDRIPPFRDSYQTALFLAVFDVLGVRSVRGGPLVLEQTSFGHSPDNLHNAPRIFELGRTAAHDLSPSDPSVDAPLGASKAAPLHPSPRPPWRPASLPALITTLLVIALAVMLWWWCVRPLSGRHIVQIGFGLSWLATLGGLSSAVFYFEKIGLDLF